MSTPRYPTALILLHWLLAIMIIGAWLAANILLEDRANSDPNKLLFLSAHAYTGLAAGLFMIVRIGVRLRGPLPESVNVNHKWALLLEKVTHWALYFTVILMALSGLATLYLTDALASVLSISGNLPRNFHGAPPMEVHEILANLLVVLVIVHVAAVIKHRVVSGTSLMKRMSFRD